MNSVIRTQCGYLHDVGLWEDVPGHTVDRWLSNFTAAEMRFAYALLDKFIYINDKLTDKIFTSAFHALSSIATRGYTDYADAKRRWQRFRDAVHICQVTGEEPSVTDSGHAFARRARQLWLIDEDHIFDPQMALSRQLAAPGTPLIFVDDFAGSGNQFLKTWDRLERVGTGTINFREAGAQGFLGPTFYCPTVITKYALQRLRTGCSEVTVVPGHVLGDEYGAGDASTVLFPASLLADKDKFIRETAARAKNSDVGPLGFHNLGLALAFQHSTPDASLPIFYTENDGWHPLVTRR